MSSEAELTNSNGDNVYYSSPTSNLIAGNGTNKLKPDQPDLNAVVTISSYKKSDNFDLPEEQTVISNRNAQTTPSPQTISRKATPKKALKTAPLVKDQSQPEDHQISDNDYPDLGPSDEDIERHNDLPEKTSYTEGSKMDRRQSNGDIMEKLKQGSEINTNFPKDQVCVLEQTQLCIHMCSSICEYEIRHLARANKHAMNVIIQMNSVCHLKEKFQVGLPLPWHRPYFIQSCNRTINPRMNFK